MQEYRRKIKPNMGLKGDYKTDRNRRKAVTNTMHTESGIVRAIGHFLPRSLPVMSSY